MRTRRHAEPRDLSAGCFHGCREAFEIVRLAFEVTLPCLFDRYDASPFTGNDRPHLLRPTSATEDDVGWRFSHGERSSHRPDGRLSPRSQPFLKKCEFRRARLPAHTVFCGRVPDYLRPRG